MKTTIIIAALLVSTAIYAGAVLRVETTEIYGDFQGANGIQTYKFTDGEVTCYGAVSKIAQGKVSTQSLSCVK